MIQETHIGLVILKNDRLIGAKYMLSKWERELGDTITVDGKAFRVGIIGDTKSDVVNALNELIRLENRLTRKENKARQEKEKAEWFANNKQLVDRLKFYANIY